MLHNYLIFTLVVLVQQNNVLFAGEIPRPRGVSISKSPLYQSKNSNFTCLDGLKVIRFIQINDDYCDCLDGSDEPGTAACPNGVFFCTNAGHRPLIIPSSRVLDGICDCCDGSDEYKPAAEVLCINTCMELGREERQQRKLEEELTKKGAALRTELSSAGKQRKSERTERLSELEERLKTELNIKSEKEEIKKDAEALESEALEMYKDVNKEEEQPQIHAAEDINSNTGDNRNEAAEAFKKFDTNSNGVLEVEEIQAHMTFDRDRDGVVSLEEAKFFLEEQDQIDLEEFVSLAWSRVKPYLMLAEGVFEAPKSEPEIENDNKEKEEEQESENEMPDVDPDDETEEEEGYESEEEGVGEGSVVEETSSTPRPPPEYDPETQRIIDLANSARSSFIEAERLVREIEQEIKDIQNQNAKDYGPQEEFATLEGECYTFDDREYVYKLCPFDRAAQQQKSGGAETTLGRWETWLAENDDNKYTYQKYSHGASCWNGPQRSAIVRMKCGLEPKITAVTEPNRCEYSFVFETPAACGETNAQGNEIHDEL